MSFFLLSTAHGFEFAKEHLGLDGELAQGEVLGTLGLSRGELGGLGRGQAATNGTGLLLAQVQGLELLGGVELSQLSHLLLVDDCQDGGDRLADHTTVATNKQNPQQKKGGETHEIETGIPHFFVLITR